MESLLQLKELFILIIKGGSMKKFQRGFIVILLMISLAGSGMWACGSGSSGTATDTTTVQKQYLSSAMANTFIALLIAVFPNNPCSSGSASTGGGYLVVTDCNLGQVIANGTATHTAGSSTDTFAFEDFEMDFSTPDLGVASMTGEITTSPADNPTSVTVDFVITFSDNAEYRVTGTFAISGYVVTGTFDVDSGGTDQDCTYSSFDLETDHSSDACELTAAQCGVSTSLCD